MLEKVKLALRISHKLLDEDIKETIDAARADMKRSGISNVMAESEEDPLIIRAIKTYCLAVYSSDSKMAEGYQVSWEYQLDNLRKSSYYMESGDSSE